MDGCLSTLSPLSWKDVWMSVLRYVCRVLCSWHIFSFCSLFLSVREFDLLVIVGGLSSFLALPRAIFRTISMTCDGVDADDTTQADTEAGGSDATLQLRCRIRPANL